MICECCWKKIDGDLYGYGGTTTCKECYERTVTPLEEIMETLLDGKEDVWMGTYALESGNRLRCHECWQFNPGDWEEKDKIVSSVYFEIDEPDPEHPGKWLCDVEGGEMGFTADSTFKSFCEYLLSWHGELVTGKLSDDDAPEDEVTE